MRKKRLKHLVTRSAHRELLLSKLMRPSEILVALLSPAFFLATRISSRSTLARHGAAPAAGISHGADAPQA